MTLDPNHVIHTLPDLEWRGLPFVPYDDLSFHFSHSQAERRYPYIDGAGHDWTGRDPIPLRARLYFLNSLREDMFPKAWNRWRVALFDGESGPLQHPILGKLRVRVMDGDVEFTAKTMAGVIVNVNFTETLDNPDEAQKFEAIAANLSSLATACTAGLAAAAIPYPDGERTSSLGELISQVEGLSMSARLTAAGMINQALGTVSRLIGLVESQNDHVNWAVRGNLIDLWNGLSDLAKQAGDTANSLPVRPTGIYKTQRDMPLDEIARAVGNTVAELMELNIGLVAAPVVPAGVLVAYYTA